MILSTIFELASNRWREFEVGEFEERGVDFSSIFCLVAASSSFAVRPNVDTGSRFWPPVSSLTNAACFPATGSAPLRWPKIAELLCARYAVQIRLRGHDRIQHVGIAREQKMKGSSRDGMKPAETRTRQSHHRGL